MDSRPIGIFDSGVGAFSVLEKLVEVLPNENYIYFGDSRHNPYGQKTTEQIQKLSKCIVDFLLKNDCKIIIIACNTATVASLEYLKNIFDIDIIGVINPGALQALRITKNNKIAVCSTVFTAKTHGYLNEIKKISKSDDLKVYEEGSSNLANIIENGFEYNEENENIVKELLSRFEDDVDTLVLGCTHFPLIEDLFKKYFKGSIVDPGMETAIQVKDLLIKKNMLNNSNTKSKIKYFVTRDEKTFKEIAKNLTSLDISEVSEVSIEEALKKENYQI